MQRNDLQNNLKVAQYSDRLFVVIDGDVYYRSTGKNSSMPGTWLPCLMCTDTEVFNSNSDMYKIPNQFNEDNLKKLLGSSDHGTGYIIKIEIDNVKANKLDFNKKDVEEAFVSHGIMTLEMIVAGEDLRYGRRIDLIRSINLGGGIWNDNDFKSKILTLLKANKNEIQKTFNLEQAHIHDLDKNPEQLNRWLLEQNANGIRQIIQLNGSETFTKLILSPLNKMALIICPPPPIKPQDSFREFFYDIALAKYNEIPTERKTIKDAITRYYEKLYELSSLLSQVNRFNKRLSDVSKDIIVLLSKECEANLAGIVAKIKNNEPLKPADIDNCLAFLQSKDRFIDDMIADQKLVCQFNKIYTEQYSHEFLKNPLSDMKNKLKNGQIQTFDEILAYASSHPDSRAAKIIDVNFQQYKNAQSIKPR